MSKPLDGKYQGYNAFDTDAARVRELFVAKHGYAPDRVILAGSIYLAGPLRERESEREPVQEEAGDELIQLAFV